MMRVFIEDSFDSAHSLIKVPKSHKCHNLHGHTYKIRLEFEGCLDKNKGWIVDYADIKEEWLKLKTQLDHKYLNDIPGLENSTCENLAKFIQIYFDKPMLGGIPLVKIELRETDRSGVVLEI